MTVYVDELRVYPNAWGPFLSGSCHLTADSLDELHEFAARIGMRRSWFQPDARLPHYDLTKSRRKAAIKIGAAFRSSRDMLRETRQRHLFDHVGKDSLGSR